MDARVPNGRPPSRYRLGGEYQTPIQSTRRYTMNTIPVKATVSVDDQNAVSAAIAAIKQKLAFLIDLSVEAQKATVSSNRLWMSLHNTAPCLRPVAAAERCDAGLRKGKFASLRWERQAS